MNKILNNSFESMRNLTAEERIPYEHYLFGLMRNTTPEEQRLYEKMLNKISIPIEGSIFDMSDIETGYCDICHKKTTINRKYYYYGLQCDCCSSEYGHFEIVKYCNNCIPKPPKWVNAEIQPIHESE